MPTEHYPITRSAQASVCVWVIAALWGLLALCPSAHAGIELVSPGGPPTQTCAGTNKFSAWDAATRTFTCSADEEGAGGADATAIHDDAAGEIAAIALKATPGAGDHLLIEDAAAANAKKRTTVGGIRLQDLSGAVTDAQVPDTITVTLAATATTATALAANGANCGAGQAAAGVDASGAAEGCTAYHPAGTVPAFASIDPGAIDIFPKWDDGGGEVVWESASTYRTSLGADDASTLSTGTIPAARVGADHIDAITEIAGALRSGTSGTLVTGTAGSNGTCAEWLDGDLVDSGAACGSGAVTLDAAFDTGAGIDGSVCGATMFEVGGATQSLRICEDATLGLMVHPVVSGSPASGNTHIFDGSPTTTYLQNAGNWDACMSQDSDGQITFQAVESCGTFAGAVTFEGVVTSTGGTKHPPTVGTADTYDMLASDCGTTIGNDDADGLTVNLLADPTGCVVCFFAETAQTITANPADGDSIILSGLTPSAGDAVQLAAAVGNNFCLQGKNTSTWWGFLGTGTVTDVD